MNNKDRQERCAPPGDCLKCGNLGHWASEMPKHETKVDNKMANNPSCKQEVQCFNCKKKGHVSYKCHKNAGLYCDEFKEEVYRRGR